MFIVYKSNKLNTLLSIASKIIEKKPLDNIFEKEIFVNDNAILFQYLNIFIANNNGISSNLKLFHPNDFIWKLFKYCLCKKNLKKTFKESTMTLKIMKILNKKKTFKHINITSNKIKKFKFSFLMANIFKKYLFYRPDWINLWEKKQNISIFDKSDEWQMKLWREMIKNDDENIHLSRYHFSNLFYSFQESLNLEVIKRYLPNRCFIISSFALTPSYMQILKKISIYINIYFLYITPSKNNALKNSLMNLWGQYELYYKLYMTDSKKMKIINNFKQNKENNLLNNIKNDLLKDNILKKKD
ncbi:exodeoxyribonuclease V subunit gamma [Buchnera aphidicola]|uniref:exodeoxyribonuclease V subunit gamma n=1 Tax=Buchnera aphidicola TaxID=9 RepID=UPI0021CA3DD7|nr:exodeoxyribonuclease V subunit gamma [Buchnera aphidicola]